MTAPTPDNGGTLRDGLWIKHAPSHYSPAQILQWLSCIGFKHQYAELDISSGAFPTTLENLKLIARLHLLSFPFENTSMHYSPDHTVDVTPDGAFRRLVVERQGSWCCGLNGVLLQMLRGLGYRAYAGAARVNQAPGFSSPPEYTSLSHMVIFVQPVKDSNETYVVDVGFGASGLARPILLSDAESNVVMGTNPTEQHRLTRGAHPSSGLARTTPKQSNYLWNLEVWHEKKGDASRVPWKILYSFSEEEFFVMDQQDASFVVSMKPERTGFLWNNVVCIKHVLFDDDEVSGGGGGPRAPASVQDRYMYRVVMMGKDIKRSVGMESVIIKTVASEHERLQALRDIFGINISDDAQRNIVGRNAALAVGI